MANYNSNPLKRLEPAYLAQYGLNEAPFSSQHNDNFLYLDAERQQKLETLKHLTQYSNLLLIVTGERGIGKTSLMRRFCNSADDSWYLCEVNANTMMDADSMLVDIAGGFGLNGLPRDPSSVQEIVFEHLKALQHDDLVPILLIDDAHELPKDALETLFYFADIEAAEGHLLRIILFCEPQIDIMLESPSIRPLRERITHTLDIQPLTEDQTAEFIKHRMAVAGFEGVSPFTPKVIRKIHKIARGIPSHICELAHLHLDDAASLNSKVVNVDLNESLDTDKFNDQFSAEDLGYTPADSEPASSNPALFNQSTFSARHYVFIAIVAIVAIIVLTMQDTINEAVAPEQTAMDTINRNLPSAIKNKKQATKPKEITLKGPEPVQATQPPAPQLEDEPTDQTQRTQQDPSQTNTTATSETESATQPGLANNVLPQAKPVKYLLSEVSPNPVSGSKKPQTIIVKGTGFKSGTQEPTVYVSWTGKTKALKQHQYKIIDDQTIELNITTGTTADNWTVQLKQNETESNKLAFNVVKPKAKPARLTTLAGFKNERWILDQEPNHFTLQLLGTYNKESLKTFSKTNKLGNNIAIYQTLRNGKPWYSLIYGSYNSREQAARIKKQISNKKVKPWLRRFDSVQAKINTEQTDTTPVKPAGKTSTASKSSTPVITNPPITQTGDSEAWLWSQDPRRYTLQLLGGRNDKSIRQFIAKYKLRDKAVYFHTRHNQRNWYALIYGSYENRQQALQAIKKLPPALQKTSPWARSFASIHKDLDQSQ